MKLFKIKNPQFLSKLIPLNKAKIMRYTRSVWLPMPKSQQQMSSFCLLMLMSRSFLTASHDFFIEICTLIQFTFLKNMGLHLVPDPHWIRIQQSLNLDPVTVLRILITLILILMMRSRIGLLTLMRMRILLFTWMRIGIHLPILIHIMQIRIRKLVWSADQKSSFDIRIYN